MRLYDLIQRCRSVIMFFSSSISNFLVSLSAFIFQFAVCLMFNVAFSMVVLVLSYNKQLILQLQLILTSPTKLLAQVSVDSSAIIIGHLFTQQSGCLLNVRRWTS